MKCVTVSEVYVTHLISYCTMTYNELDSSLIESCHSLRGMALGKRKEEGKKEDEKEEEKDASSITWQSLLTAKMPFFFLSDNICNAMQGRGLEECRGDNENAARWGSSVRTLDDQ